MDMTLPNSGGTFALPADEHAEDRRDFVKVVAAGTLALGIGGAVVEAGRFLKPNVLYEPSKVFRVGDPSSFPIGSRTVIEGRGVEIVRERDGIHAISLVCTHLGCLLRPVENDPECGYACPCHGSRFTMTGEVLGGPAPRELPWYEVYVDVTGDLVVDTSRVNEARTKLVV
jgi:cytochrome b6-f complex iron-sulfur subunit